MNSTKTTHKKSKLIILAATLVQTQFQIHSDPESVRD